jgi:hypothetical protein
MNTLKIEIPKGYEIDSFDKLSGEIKFKEKSKSVTERIKTVHDVLVDNGFTARRFECEFAGLTEDEIAYRILKMLAKSLNEEWKPDWNNPYQRKYYVRFQMDGSSGFRFNDCDHWCLHSGVGSRLYFKSHALAEHAGTHFTDVYKKFMVV